MIPRKLRLSRAQFASTTKGKRAISAHFSVTYRRVPENGGCAAVVSKKVAKRSVDRHQLKRRILASAQSQCSPHLALVIYARSGSTTLSYTQLHEELTLLLAPLMGA